jgi:hypothetical protein
MGRAARLLLTLALLAVASSGCANRGVGTWALAEDGADFVGRYMGGGSHYGSVRDRTEGTWARDYAGLDLFHLIDLRWAHSTLAEQDGIGSY